MFLQDYHVTLEAVVLLMLEGPVSALGRATPSRPHGTDPDFLLLQVILWCRRTQDSGAAGQANASHLGGAP